MSGTINLLCSDRLTDLGEGATYQSTFLDVKRAVARLTAAAGAIHRGARRPSAAADPGAARSRSRAVRCPPSRPPFGARACPIGRVRISRGG